MDRKELAFTVSILFAVFAFYGCETLKGVDRDIKNTGNNIVKAPERLEKIDHWMQENWW